MWTIGHRGASAHAPENTIAAFLLAQQHGVDMVELDVRRCKSGEIVVFHDSDTERLMPSEPNHTVEQLTWDEIRRLPWLVPRLRDVLEVIVDVRLNIELKGENVVDGVVQVVKAMGRVGDVLFSCDEFARLCEMKKRLPHALYAMIYPDECPSLEEIHTHLKSVDMYSIHINVEHFSPDRLFTIKEEFPSLNIFVYTINDPCRMDALLLHIDGIFTDRTADFTEIQLLNDPYVLACLECLERFDVE